MDAENVELLRIAIENGMIDTNTIIAQVKMNERKKFIDMHESKIWQGAGGMWYTYLHDEQKGRKLVKRKTKDDIYDEIVKYYKSQKDEPTIRAVFDEWISGKLKYNEIQKQTYDRYITDFNRYFVNNESFKDYADRKIRYICEDDLEEFIKITISCMRLTQKAYSNLRTLINGIFKYAKKKGYTSLSISTFIGDLDLSRRSFRKNIKDKDAEVYQEAEAEKLSEYLREQSGDLKCLGLLLTFETGMRIGELCGLKPDDISGKYIHICRTEVKLRDDDGNWVTEIKEYPKSEAGDRYIIISDSAKETLGLIMQARTNGEYLFTCGSKRIRSHSFRQKLRVVCKELDIRYRSNHKIRKTYGTMLIDNGVDDSIVAEQMGHTDIATTRRYYYFSNKSEDKKREQINHAVIL